MDHGPADFLLTADNRPLKNAVKASISRLFCRNSLRLNKPRGPTPISRFFKRLHSGQIVPDLGWQLRVPHQPLVDAASAFTAFGNRPND